MSMFWGLIVKGNTNQEEEVPQDFNLVLTQAAIDRSASEPSTLYIETEGFDKLALCTLSWGRCEQARIELLFDQKRKVKFSSVGKGDIHLTGYVVPNMDQEFSDDDLSDLGESDEDLQEDIPKRKRQLSTEQTPATKKPKQEKQSSKVQKESPKKTGESCDTCNKQFSTPESLAQHKTIKHGTPPTAEKKKKEEGTKKEEHKKVKAEKAGTEQKESESGVKAEDKKAKKKKKKTKV